MTKPQAEIPDEGALVRRMHRSRHMQWAIAFTSLALAGLGVAYLSPANVGSFAYYTLLGLMLLNATIALRQSLHVLFPIETMLRKIRLAERDIDAGRLESLRFAVHSNDAFACLTAGIDNLVAKLVEKTRIANERASLDAAMLQAIPFTMYTVSGAGTVYAIIRDQYDLVPLLDIKVGAGPSKEAFGERNAATYLANVANSFKTDDFRWFDLDVGAHHLRATVRRINQMTSLVAIGDLPAIDQVVSNMTGNANENDFSHRLDSLKRFAATIAHDGKNIFTTLNNIVAVSRETGNETLLEQVQIAEETIRRGTNLMTELSAFAGEMRLNLQCMPADKCAATIIGALSLKTLLPTNVTLLTSVSQDPMPEVDIDADQMWKVTSNIVRNSVEAMNGNDGRIWLKIEPCTLTEDAARSFRHSGSLRKGKGILVTISDDGPGIPDAQLEHLFEPFVSTKGENRGIGLASALTIVDAHGGAVSVKSSSGYGATFYIYLPASRHTAEELAIVREIAPNGEILLVDDDPTILHTTALVLKSLKIAAHPASTESDALTKVRTLRTRLRAVLIDANLGCSSSACLVRTIRSEMPSLPIILVSGSPQETIARRFSGVRYDRFLAKPYSVGELAKALADVSPSK